ncbi:triosephosphate isomerase [Pirellula staleyi DSM 6068]|uniref:Triosephosphate isomerase n=1 Tax=Pirellula staleyi (strain ATCC 27377 / DSM 6068 / ICPB 4128) TaxID=530564 RepID=D2QWI9_PIRSD|nr:triose-phosphate isomerase [Pirellula staleyi]ADB17792.1 triosephosphate isomerase [Pirellula staleyi DSM 6068]
MRKKFIAGNWKMNLTKAAAVELAAGLAAKIGTPSVDVAVCPPSVYLDAVVGALAGSAIQVGGQNCYHEPKGAFTGELSAAMLLDIGCKYVILGHSERRHILKETNADIQKKVVAALAAGLTPILCVGELLSEREAGQTAAVVHDQFDGSLAGISAEQVQQVVIAYEPVWAIGTGKVATPEQAEEVHANLRAHIAAKLGQATADVVRIQYGGSVTAENAATLLHQPNIDGALVGGASLKVESFLGIVAGATKS